MRRLDKKQQARLEELTNQLTGARDELNEAIRAFNAAMAQLHGELAPKVDAVNAAITAANDFAAEIHDELDGYFDDKSERWQESDAGQAYSDWRDSWDIVIGALELEEIAPFDEIEIELDEFEAIETEVPS